MNPLVRTLSVLVALTCACAPPGSQPPNARRAAAFSPFAGASPQAGATPTASVTPTTSPAAQTATARCQWSKLKGTSGAGRVTAAGDEQIDVVRLAIGLPPRTDDERKKDAEQARIDDELEGTIGCEVLEVHGKLIAASYAAALDQVLDEVAGCLHQPGRARKEQIVVRLSFDARGQPLPAHWLQSKPEAAAATCLESVLSELEPASYASDQDTRQPLTADAQTNASALVRLELDMPAVR